MHSFLFRSLSHPTAPKFTWLLHNTHIVALCFTGISFMHFLCSSIMQSSISDHIKHSQPVLFSMPLKWWVQFLSCRKWCQISKRTNTRMPSTDYQSMADQPTNGINWLIGLSCMKCIQTTYAGWSRYLDCSKLMSQCQLNIKTADLLLG